MTPYSTNDEDEDSALPPDQLIIPSATSFKYEHPTPVVAAQTKDATALTLLTVLKAAGVKFVRFTAIDCTNGMRCKAVPLDRLLADPSKFYSGGLAFDETCFAGSTCYDDHVVAASGLTSAQVLILHPDVTSLRVLPYNPSTAMVLGVLHDQLTGTPSPLCTRLLLQRVKQTAESDFNLSFVAGIEIEFALFHENTDTAVEDKRYCNAALLNEQQDFIHELYEQLKAQSIDIEQIHAECAPGQMEVVLSKHDDVLRLADDVVLARDTIQACAKSQHLRAIFLPKMHPTELGNASHIHLSFRDLAPTASRNDKDNAFRGTSAMGPMSQKGSFFMEGILQHLPALLGVTLPSTNGFRRIGPDFFTGTHVGWAVEDKECSVRVCRDHYTGETSNLEFKLSDAIANVHLVMAVVISAGLDGIAKQMALRPALGDDKTALEELLPATLQDSLDCLKKDEVLLGVMGKELSRGFIAVKEAEIAHGMGMSIEDEVALALKNA